jgi:hypothetical protein
MPAYSKYLFDSLIRMLSDHAGMLSRSWWRHDAHADFFTARPYSPAHEPSLESTYTSARIGDALIDELLTQPLRQPLPDEPRSNVGCAGGSERHDQAHRPRRIGLRPCDARHRVPAARCRNCRRGSFILNLPSRHSITSSARVSREDGMVRPKALAVEPRAWRRSTEYPPFSGHYRAGGTMHRVLPLWAYKIEKLLKGGG